jgi:Flp pilus assembly protein TadD
MSPKVKRRSDSKEPSILELWRATSETVGPLKVAMLTLALVVVAVYFRIFGAGFLGYDDDIHVYANPFLNPLSFENVSKLWHQAYKGLYIPLAYTILAGVAVFAEIPAQTMSTLGRTVTFSPEAFHATSIGFHAANALLCFLLVLRLSRSRKAALVCALVFALHPLQVESVGWISELRGLSSSFFALVALNAFVLSRQFDDHAPKTSRSLLAASTVFVICSMLCKPAAVVLPLVGLAIDRVAIGSSWRRSLVNASIWCMCALPLAWVTQAIQVVHPEGASIWWQRPFVAGDSLAFYIFKTVAPINLCVEYGRTPHAAMSHAWSYIAWVLPVGLLALCFVHRQRRPIAWLGSLLFVIFLLPTLGLVPFTFQAHSTVADRYAYLSMIGIGLVISESVAAVRADIAQRTVSVAIFVLAILSFNQSGNWVDNAEFLRHTIDVNPNVAFAHNNLGSILLKQDQVDEAIEHFNAALKLDPGNAEAQNNFGLVLVQRGRLEEAEPHYRRAVQLNPRYFKAYENLGALYLRMERFDEAIASLKAAIELQPSEAKALNDLGVAFMQSGRTAEGLDAFQRAVSIEPNNARYRKNVGYALLQQGRAQEAAPYLNP